jgi:ribosomal protein S8
MAREQIKNMIYSIHNAKRRKRAFRQMPQKAAWRQADLNMTR